jgi:hypothetical protein
MDKKKKGEVKISGAAMNLLFVQAHFKVTFFEAHPQCEGCENVDVLVMDYEIYPAFKKRYCVSCEKYEGW